MPWIRMHKRPNISNTSDIIRQSTPHDKETTDEK
jgi:hypothetical protein